MQQPDRPVVWGVSAYQLADVFRQAGATWAGRVKLEVIESHFDAALAEIRARLLREHCDVIVSAGANADYLASHLSLPVISVRVGGHDLLGALIKARHQSERIAVVLHKAAAGEIESFAHCFSVPLVFRFYETEQQARLAMRALASEGIRVVVGAGVAVDMAEAAGLAGVFIYTAASVHLALEDALRMVQAKQIEQSRSALLTTVLHHLGDGVIALDGAGRVIAANPAAERLTNCALNSALGQPLHQQLPALALSRALISDQAESGTVEEVAGQTLVVDRAPLFDGGVRIGAVFTLHPPRDVEHAFSRLRAYTHRRSKSAKYSLHDIVAESPSMQAVVKRCKVLAEHSDATLLISGPSGVGKELLAQGLHNASPRRRQPFVAVNCGAFPETLLESELFGYEEGAFTGAKRNGKAGLFETADKGTVFLDEIAELPLLLQTRLLRVLQEREVTRLGGFNAVAVDVRIVAATHRELLERVRSGAFREDLYYRIGALRVVVPPLRERPEDLDALARRFVTTALGRLGLGSIQRKVVAAALPVLRRHAWPGNVRELENLAERLAIGCLEKGSALVAEEISALLDPPTPANTASPITAPSDALVPARQRQEKSHIRAVLDECAGNQAEAARRLGIGRTTLWRKLRS